MAKGKLYLIPSPLGEYDPAQVIPAPVLERLRSIRKYVVEEARTVRRYLSAAGLRGHIGELELRELNKPTQPSEVESLLPMFSDPDGSPSDVGLISEAGLPAVADPGARLVALCHIHGIQVVPMVGPSSLMLALMGSGLNGQSFAFCGYLPAKTDERRKAIREIVRRSSQLNQTEMFIETPYRNRKLADDILEHCKPQTRLCIAMNISCEDEYVVTRRVTAWRGKLPDMHKKPCVFLLYRE